MACRELFMSEKSRGYIHNDWLWDLEMFSAGMSCVRAVGPWKAEIFIYGERNICVMEAEYSVLLYPFGIQHW